MKIPFVLASLLLAPWLPRASAQCEPGWAPGFSFPAWNGEVRAFAVLDDGGGPSLFAGGNFTTTGVIAHGVSRWNGAEWSPLPFLGGPSDVFALAVWNDGTGDALYVADQWQPVRWNGSAWAPFANGINGGTIRAFAAFDDGSGPALYAGGSFEHISGLNTPRIARWNGTTWSPVGAGLPAGQVRALFVHDDGSGPKLYAGGTFQDVAGTTSDHLARWDGVAWAPVGGGTDAPVEALAAYDDGTGTKLYASGGFTIAGGVPANGIARWDGASWSPLGGGANVGTVSTLATHSLGGSPVLVAGGDGMASWDGSQWTSLAPGGSGLLRALALHDEGQGLGTALFAGGNFTTIDGLFSARVARWQPSGWSALDLGQGFDGRVFALARADDGSGTAQYAGGNFLYAGSTPAPGIARRTANGWAALGSGVSGAPSAGTPSVHDLLEFDDGTGSALYVAGYFTEAGGLPARCIARWKNGAWSSIGDLSGPTGFGRAYALAEFDDGTGPALYVGGDFLSAGGVAASQVARWDGTSWSPSGTGLSPSSYEARALAVFDDGNGAKLYAVGRMYMGQVVTVARLVGGAWSQMMTQGDPYAAAVYDDGTGSALYVGGLALSVPGVGSANLARWNGVSWSAVPGIPSTGTIRSLAVENVGGVETLLVGGTYGVGGGPPANLARYDGQGWTVIGSGVIGTIDAILPLDDGLAIGGGFAVQSTSSLDYAEWREVCAWTSVCAGDGSAGPCPCGNTGALGNGCANSVDAGGAGLAASGTIAPDSLSLATSGTPPSALTVFFKGSALVSPIPFGDGLRCAGGVLVRFGVQNAVGGSAFFPHPGDPRISVLGSTPPGSGLTAVYQAFYRDPAAAFCPPGTFSSTNALRVIW